MKSEITDKRKCCGCAACMNICPKGCITMESDREGFLYPVIRYSECENCQMCTSVCQSNVFSRVINTDRHPKVIAAISKEETSLQNSTSGGIAFVLSKCIIEKGGEVWGAAYDRGLNVRHICVSDISDLYKLQKSKYVQSDLGYAYRQIRQSLRGGGGSFFHWNALSGRRIVSFPG